MKGSTSQYYKVLVYYLLFIMGYPFYQIFSIKEAIKYTQYEGLQSKP